MRGDGMGGMALAIEIVGWLMVVAPGVLAAWLFSRWRRLREGKYLALTVGLGLGALWRVSLFFEETSWPTPELTIEVPTGFAYQSVFFLTAPTSNTEIQWSGGGPFRARRATVAVPKSGILRVRELGLLSGHTINARFSDGRVVDEQGGFGSDPRCAYFVVGDGKSEPPFYILSDADTLSYVARREAANIP